MAKLDVAVHLAHCFLLGMKWHGHYYVDLALTFGPRSVPYIFNTVAEAVEWILLHCYNVSDLLHYLDDLITAGPNNSPQCAQNFSTSLQVCKHLGLSLPPWEVCLLLLLLLC